jgi:peptidoglycan/xylan/chitin deacetylase (PgdA/CDA1 family)
MKKMPVLLTFDVDGECIWLCRDPENVNRPVTLSLGQYGIEEGVPRILRMLEKYELFATFFVPGYIADKYPEVVRAIDVRNHEIGNHSWTHTYPDKMESAMVEEQEYVATSDLLEKLTGKRPKGYRSPAWEFSAYTIDILERMGDIEYSSNMMNRDRVSYLKVNGKESPLVEIPIHWVLDDAAFWLYSVRIPGKAIQPLEAVESFWKAEFSALYEEFEMELAEKGDSDICFVLTCHPQVIGRPARMKVLESVIKHILRHEKVQFMTAGDVAARFKADHPK